MIDVEALLCCLNIVRWQNTCEAVRTLNGRPMMRLVLCYTTKTKTAFASFYEARKIINLTTRKFTQDTKSHASRSHIIFEGLQRVNSIIAVVKQLLKSQDALKIDISYCA